MCVCVLRHPQVIAHMSHVGWVFSHNEGFLENGGFPGGFLKGVHHFKNLACELQATLVGQVKFRPRRASQLARPDIGASHMPQSRQTQ